MTKDESAPARRRIFCNTCSQDTHHILRCQHRRDAGDEDFFLRATYKLWTCAGCDTGTLEEVWTGELYQDGDGNLNDDCSYHPVRSGNTVSPKVFQRLPEKLKTIYKEAILAFNAGLYTLCGGGLRALIEGICQDRGISGRNLEERIDGLLSILPNKTLVESLHGFRFMGNEALHELSVPRDTDLKNAIGVAEDLLNFIFELDYKASRLPRKSRENR